MVKVQQEVKEIDGQLREKKAKRYDVVLQNTYYTTVTVYAIDDDDAWEQGEEIAYAGDIEHDETQYDGWEVNAVEES